MDSVSVFLEIVKNGSISRTAQKLGYSQSNVSHILSGLEEDLNVTLLVRGRQGIRLTTEGEILLPYFREIAASQDRLAEKVQEMHGLTAGKIRVAAFPSVYLHWMPRILKAFSESYPLIEFELLSGSYPTIENFVQSGEADCGFVHLPTRSPMQTYALKKDSFYAILPADHLLAEAESVTLERLAEEPFIMSDDLDEDEVARLFRSRFCTPSVLYTVPDPPTVAAMVGEGLGVSILTDLASEGITEIVRIPLSDVQETRKVGLAVSAQPSAAVRIFTEFVREWVAETYA